jgi:hypothetical protein
MGEAQGKKEVRKVVSHSPGRLRLRFPVDSIDGPNLQVFLTGACHYRGHLYEAHGLFGHPV